MYPGQINFGAPAPALLRTGRVLCMGVERPGPWAGPGTYNTHPWCPGIKLQHPITLPNHIFCDTDGPKIRLQGPKSKKVVFPCVFEHAQIDFRSGCKWSYLFVYEELGAEISPIDAESRAASIYGVKTNFAPAALLAAGRRDWTRNTRSVFGDGGEY